MVLDSHRISHDNQICIRSMIIWQTDQDVSLILIFYVIFITIALVILECDLSMTLTLRAYIKITITNLDLFNDLVHIC